MGEKLKELSNQIDQSEVAIVYGAGENAGGVISWLEKKNIHILIAVSDFSHQESFRGYAVFSIDELRAYDKTAVVLVSTFPGFFAEIKEKLDRYGFESVYYLDDWFLTEAFYEEYWKRPIQQNRIIVENFAGNGYADNPKYIVRELLNRKEDLEIVWIRKWGQQIEVPEGIIVVDKYSEEYFEMTATAKVWISNVRKYQPARKRKGQYYIQTWHGFTLKRIEKDAESTENSRHAPYYDAARKDSAMTDLLLSNSSFLTDTLRECFWYDGEIAETGSPRNDVFWDDVVSIYNNIREYYGLDKYTRIVLYAPTFRNEYSQNPFDVDFNRVLDALEQRTKSKYVLLCRMHNSMKSMDSSFQYSNRVINATNYVDMMELLVATDVLVTDYSSSIFDYIITGRPVFLYAKDLERYRSDDRGFYLDYCNMPFPVAINNDELCQNIYDFDEKEYKEKLAGFREELGFYDDGNASKRVADRIMDVIKNK